MSRPADRAFPYWSFSSSIDIYTKKILKRFYMDKAYPLSLPMIVCSLDVKKDPFRSCEKCEKLLGPEVPYLSAISALMYLAN